MEIKFLKECFFSKDGINITEAKAGDIMNLNSELAEKLCKIGAAKATTPADSRETKVIKPKETKVIKPKELKKEEMEDDDDL